ncbi:class I SAM-dependent methyltransferase [Jannaschia donghaensis]|uniref:Ribosomal RNA small subunit methyltransferase C n=1 Tax=Jannaschia donghaensis TaxID=420998 RepID=A0A0M6YDK0_9RHOB|nr:class I SAM-dependent methyltransferase [Jannaschia donghaensis]CTQ48408.1 Ribosomal RNA small subunit methyltransferase C [Jannaschia donghaensis]
MNDRLSLALAADAVTLPEGRILLLRPPADLDVGDLPGQITAVHGFKPDHDRLAARDIDVAPRLEGRFDAAVVFIARAKAQTLDMIAQAITAVPPGAPIIVDGQKVDGADSIVRLCRKAFDIGDVFAKAHGKTFSFPAGPIPDGWAAEPQQVDGFVTGVGVFSADGVDAGSALLASHLTGLSGRVCDLGAGWGHLSRVVLQNEGVTACALIEAEHDAMTCARLNVVDPRAAFHWADATTWTGGPFDVVVSNPPFHTARRADPSLGRAFITAAARLLTPGGRLLMVANRHLPYEETLNATFGAVAVLTDKDGFKVIEAKKPKRQRGRT